MKTLLLTLSVALLAPFAFAAPGAVITRAAQVDVELKADTLHRGIACRSDVSQHYALYLPPQFDGKTALPVIICFAPDPHGAESVERLQAAARELGFAVLGATTIRSGAAERIAPRIQTVWTDLSTRMPVHASRNIVLGREGSARAAQWLAEHMAAVITGRIYIGAVPPQPKGGFEGDAVFGIVGHSDPAMSTFRDAARELGDGDAGFWVAVHDGGEGWPARELLKRGLQYIEATRGASASSRGAFASATLAAADAARARQPLIALSGYEQLRTQFGDTAAGMTAAQRAEALAASQDVAVARAAHRSIGHHLTRIMSGTTVEFQESLDWFRDAIRRGDAFSRQAGTALYAAQLRLKSQGLMHFEAKDYVASGRAFERAAKLIVSDHAAWYNAACAFAHTQQRTRACNLLEQSVGRGFKNLEHITTDPDLAGIRGEAAYQALVTGLKAERDAATSGAPPGPPLPPQDRSTSPDDKMRPPVVPVEFPTPPAE